MIRHLRLILGLLLLVATPLGAQDSTGDTAVLVADDVRVTADNRLIASGNVEALYQGRRLKAREITYDRATEHLVISGPLTLTDGEGTVVVAQSAELDRDLTNGILRSARVVMQDQLQLAAVEMRRTDARFNQLYKAAVTSCRVCDTGRPPLWQIRAQRVIHDEQARQLYFDNAQFRILNTTVLYLPRLRLPDATLDRARGFLTPSLVNSSLLGTGIRVPYFIPIGESRDLTLAPFLATNSKRLEFRYRQAFRTGEIEFNGAVAEDDFSRDPTRGYLFGQGRFELPRDFILRFNIELTSDDTFLLDHDFSDKDRLTNEISIERARRDEYARIALSQFQSLRVGESNTTLPTVAGNAEYERRFFPTRLGGELRFGAALHSHYRSSDSTVATLDRYADGRDVTRFTSRVDWYRGWTLPLGVLASFQTGLILDHFEISQAGITSAADATELTPTLSFEVRWPLLKSTHYAVTHVVEPVAQLAWAGGSNPDVPLDEATLIEFDEGNLFNPSRFNAPDRRERGYRAAYGVNWTRIDPAGWQGSLALGQVWRNERLIERDGITPTFSKSSGLSDHNSDLLIAGQFRNATGLTVTARSLFDSVFDTTRAEARASWRNDYTNIGATYVWLSADPAENRPSNVSEWAIDGSYRFAKHWTGHADWRFDAVAHRSVRAGAGLTYSNECVDITLSVSRRFTSSTILEPETNIGFTVGFTGFSSATRDKSFTRTCRN